MISIYNPAKELFMSPMADGPIKFIGSLENDDLRLEHITRFGRKFSIVCIPYSFKLLIQELQTINAQIRIITEDNIDQLESMSFSQNIQTLLDDKEATPKSLIDSIQKRITEKQIQRTDTPTPDTPTPETPPYAPFSPAYVPGSPDYVPGSPDYVPGSPAYVPGSPAYNPNSPAYDPNSPADKPNSP
jgi:hypothetical protein